MKIKNRKKFTQTLLAASGSAALIGPAITMFNTQTEVNVNDDENIEQVTDSETLSIDLSKTGSLWSPDINSFFGGDAVFTASLGFVHSALSGRGWSNMYWGNEWTFDHSTHTNENLIFRDYGLGNQKGIAASSGITNTAGRSFKYSDHREQLVTEKQYKNGNSIILNRGSLNSTLAYENYEIDVTQERNDASTKIFESNLHSNFTLGENPNLQDDVSSSFLLLLYSMFITGESYELTGDRTMETTPEIQFIEPVFQLTRNSELNKYNDVSLASAVTSGLLGAIIGGVSGGPAGAIANGVGSALIGLFMPQMNGAGAEGVKMSLEEPDFVPIDGAKAFLWDSSVMLKNKYFEDESYTTDKFFITDISLNMNLETKLSYDGWNGWKPYAIMSSPSVSMSYVAEGTRIITTATTYDYSNWLIEKRGI